MFELALKTLVAYLMGALMGALILGAFSGVDIRTLGSGNAGGTNALRTRGKAFALGVVVIDVLKGWLVVAWLPGITLPMMPSTTNMSLDWVTGACAVAAVIGHLYPVWFDFRGGKGAATTVGVVLGMAPTMMGPLLLVWVLTLVSTGYVGLATMLAVSMLPVTAAASDPPALSRLVAMLVIAGLVIYAHRANLTRMLEGNEHRARRVWLFRPRVDRS